MNTTTDKLDDMDYFEKVSQVVATAFKVDVDTIIGTEHFANDFGADSLDIVMFMMELENQFEIEITDEEETDLTSVNKVVEFLKSTKGGK